MGILIVLEGLDGSGKGTQTELLKKHLEAKNKKVRVIDFPDYSSEGCTLVKMYLGGKLGDDPDDTNAYAASAFFAVDRYASFKADWKKDYDKLGKVVIANRYSSANAVHQLSKLPRDQWDAFIDWLWDFEFMKLGIPAPDLVLYLELPPEMSLELVRRRSEETGQARDIHEKDAEYMRRCYDAALYASDKLGWERIRCYDENGIRTREAIFHDIAEVVSSRTELVL